MKCFDEFEDVVRQLRRKCPWDSIQTHESLKKHLMEESEEVLEAIDFVEKDKNGAGLCEELGDVLFQVVLHSLIAEEEGLFTLEDVIEGATSKMKFRHPKIFAPEDKALAKLSWESLKQLERQQKHE